MALVKGQVLTLKISMELPLRLEIINESPIRKNFTGLFAELKIEKS